MKLEAGLTVEYMSDDKNANKQVNIEILVEKNTYFHRCYLFYINLIYQ